MNLPVLFQNYASLIDQIEHDQPHLGDTLFIRGEKSDYILDQDFHNIHHIFPRSKIVTIPHAGHWVHAEQPDLLVKELQNFFDNFIP
jgi:pimeloyl-ACP methyl ester carboxylesterase